MNFEPIKIDIFNNILRRVGAKIKYKKNLHKKEEEEKKINFIEAFFMNKLFQYSRSEKIFCKLSRFSPFRNKRTRKKLFLAYSGLLQNMF
jgi:hypothetical protein